MQEINKLEIIGTIDYCYWQLEQLNKKLQSNKSPIDAAIDYACGYDEVEDIRKQAIQLIEQIIESKKLINSDYSYDIKFLDNLKSIQNDTSQR